MDKNENYNINEIKDIREIDLIKRLTKSFKKKNISTIIDVGDDAAIGTLGQREDLPSAFAAHPLFQKVAWHLPTC